MRCDHVLHALLRLTSIGRTGLVDVFCMRGVAGRPLSVNAGALCDRVQQYQAELLTAIYEA